MATFQCKMCGGALEINDAQTIATCKYCGTKQTLPKLNTDRKANLYERAGHFRRNNDFDKAMAVYEQILDEDLNDAESYWSILLCRYGVEYVEDPATGRRMITINRAQYTSIFDDEDYKSALRYADSEQRALYEAEAAEINEIQKGYLAISQKEAPFDVFICYKESDERGRRTRDSVLATELYGELVREGFKVFFSRITLEDKLGEAYEPYIFSALHSAKVMVVLGTRPEYFEAVWVKNEWGRYLSLIKNGAKKTLIPAYRDMDPYDLPEEFSHLQAQDMSRLGFMHDLVWAIRKLVKVDEKPKEKAQPKVQETIYTNVAPTNVAPLIKRTFMFLEDGEWEHADEYAEKALDLEPENAQAYLAKLMLELRVCKMDDLANCAEPFDENHHYVKVMRFADDALKNQISGYIKQINERNERALKEEFYRRGVATMNSAKTEKECQAAADIFKKIQGYKDADELVDRCLEKVEIIRKDAILSAAKSAMGVFSIARNKDAIEMLESIRGWRDADNLIVQCQKNIEKIQAQAEAARMENERLNEISHQNAEKRKKRNKKIACILLIIAGIIAFVILLTSVIIPSVQYKNARALMENGKYVEALEIFESLSGYKDSVDKMEACNSALEEMYNSVIDLLNKGAYEDAYDLFISLGTYKDRVDYIQKNVKNIAKEKATSGEYFAAYDLMNKFGYVIESDAFMAGCLGMVNGGSFAFLQANPSCLAVEIPDGVTSIVDYAFNGCNSLTSVTLPNSVTNIGASAFEGCSSLTSITISNSVTSIGRNAFEGCSSLTNVTAPIFAFESMPKTNLKTVVINGGTSIGSYMFNRCSSLTSVTIPNSVTSIGASAFDGCSSLTSITIPTSVTSIGSYAFYRCSSLASVTFESTQKWKQDTTLIPATDLASLATAAIYLKSTYCNRTWTRS